MTQPISMRKHLLGAVLAAAALRVLFVWQYPGIAGDTPIYDELARNWVDHGIYGMWIGGQLTPVDIRAPGFPAFLAVIYAIFGRTYTAVMYAQVVVDVATCVLAGFLAARIAPRDQRKRAFAAAVWLAALCPFVANYCATVLTEVLATFLTTLALFLLVNFTMWFVEEDDEAVEVESEEGRVQISSGWFWMTAGVMVGLGTLVRPETPLILGGVGLVLCARWWRPKDWKKLIGVGLWMGAGLLLALAPWAARNWTTLHKVQFLAPRYAELEGEFVPHGFNAWTKTWLVRFQDVYTLVWKAETQPLRMEDLPDSAFDSAEERARVAALVEQHNTDLSITPEMDREFAELARARTARHPLRTYVWVPARRVWTMWFTPRVEMLPYSGSLWPVAEKWKEDPVDYSVTLAMGLFNFVFVGLAIAGARRCWRHPAAQMLIVFVILRTMFLTQVETPEPRYVLVCFPALMAVAGQWWVKKDSVQ